MSAKLAPGILRRPSVQSPALGHASPSQRIIHGTKLGSPMMPQRAVHFEPPSNLRDLLIRAANEKETNPKTLEELEGHLTHIKNMRGPSLVAWLQLLQENIVVLKPKMENFVLALLKIAWTNQDQTVVAAYRNFLTNLVSAQGYYVKPVVRMLIGNFVGFIDRQAILEQSPRDALPNIDEMEVAIFENTHLALKAVLEVTPLASRQAILQYSKECIPYKLTTDTRAHTNYITNLMSLTQFMKSDRRVLLRIVISRLVELDAHLPRQDESRDDSDDEDLFEVEAINTVGRPKSMTEVARDSLDCGLLILFKYIQDLAAAEDKDELKAFYFDFLSVFESHILPVYATGHVQFLMFYLLSFRAAFVGHFLDHLWKLFCSVNTPSIIRQSTVAYIASLIARGNFIKVPVLLACLEKVVQWIHSYINNREPNMATDVMMVDIKSHGPFYAACQGAFYMFAFRHDELVHNRKHMSMLRSLQFNSIVTCHLNPLRVCLPPVVKNFASVARNFQLAYCDTIIQRNSRINLPVVGNLSSSGASLAFEQAKPVLLDSFFPFDPYRLINSKVFVDNIYRFYQGNSDGEESSEDDDDDEEEAMEEDGDADKSHIDQGPEQVQELEKIMMDISGKSYSEKSSMSDFIYGTSPGFLS